jgi:phosphate transport system substrate-binding protein
VEIEIGAGGTAAALARFCAGELPLAHAARALNSAELAACAAAGVTFIELPLAYDAVCFLLGKRSDLTGQLTVDQLRGICGEGGGIASWKQLSAQYPELPLLLAGPPPESDLAGMLAHTLLQDGRLRGDYRVCVDDAALLQALAAEPGTLLFCSLTALEPLQPQARLLTVATGNVGGEPGEQAVSDGSYTPYSFPLFLYINTAALKRPEVAALVEAYARSAPISVREAGLVPLRNEAYLLMQQRLRERRTGSMFAGADTAGLTFEALQLKLE